MAGSKTIADNQARHLSVWTDWTEFSPAHQ
jgi:hypothetical protein